MPAQSCTPYRPTDPFHRVIHALPQTTDAGFFTIPDANAPAPMKSRGLDSKSVKDCRLSAHAAAPIRSKSNVGITGGYVHGATADATNGGTANHRATVLARRSVKAGKRDAKRAAKRAYVLAELQRRGYNV